ncbi:YndM family protein [Bacillus sp. V3B]|uniref:YndM family protein n=1 Tax=Bacillus sp. V3B TaxID=2804915 RepID=UPI002109D44C|nr:YndM family protein [Bacillus sp. V3B]MCQ6277104.1 YndM family protein [Bacillus sp. V3B]
MKHVWALSIKFAAIGTVLFSIFGIFNIALPTLVIMSVVTTVIAYFVGDLVILPKLGNLVAILGDLILTFGLLLMMSYLFIDTTLNRVSASSFSALSITAIEVLFHLYVKKHIFTNSDESYIPTVTKSDQFATEFSKELKDTNTSPKTDDE